MAKSHVVFISTPGIGNLVPLVEFAQLLVNHDRRLHATILIITMSQRPVVNAYIQSRVATSTRITFLHLPPADQPSPDQYRSTMGYISLLIQNHKPHVKNAITKLMSSDSAESNSSNSDRVVGFFVDMFCISMIDVANELGLPCYLYFASPATFLSFMLHLPFLDAQNPAEFVDLSTELSIPGFVNSVPPLVLPTAVLNKKGDAYSWYLSHARRYTETKGIVVNTFRELEGNKLGTPPGIIMAIKFERKKCRNISEGSGRRHCIWKRNMS